MGNQLDYDLWYIKNWSIMLALKITSYGGSVIVQ